ncbi:MAG: BolA family protein [Burkholderiaceae bacterium]
MRARLACLTPLELAIEDDSARHAGHPGAAAGGGHYNLRMTSPRFEGQSRVERHRLVYHALADLMQREVHALAMVLLAPSETQRRAGAPLPTTPGH